MNITPDSLRDMARQLTAESKKAKEKKNSKSKKDEEVETADVEKSFDSLSKFALGARDKIESSAEDEDDKSEDKSEDNSGAECEDSSCADEIIDFDTLNAASLDDEDDFEDEVLDLGGDDAEDEDDDDVEDDAEDDIDVIDDFEDEDEYEVDEAEGDNKQKTIRKPGVLKKAGKAIGWLGKNLLSWKGIGAAILGAAFGGLPGLAILAAASVYDKHKAGMNSWLQKHRLAESLVSEDEDITAVANSPEAKNVKKYIGSLSKEEQKKINDTMLKGSDEEKQALIAKFKEIAAGKTVAEGQPEENCEVEVVEDEDLTDVVLGLIDKLPDDEKKKALDGAVQAIKDEKGTVFEDVSTPREIADFVRESVYYDQSRALRVADRKYRRLLRENAGKAHVIAHRLDESCKGKPVAERDFCKKFVRIMR